MTPAVLLLLLLLTPSLQLQRGKTLGVPLVVLLQPSRVASCCYRLCSVETPHTPHMGTFAGGGGAHQGGA